MLPESNQGRVSAFKNEGDILKEGDLVATVGATDFYIINSVVGELNVKKLRVGDTVDISGPGFRQIVLQGRVDWIAAESTSEGDFRYYQVRVIIPDVPDSLRSEIKLGMFADVTVRIDELIDAVTLPIEAVSYKMGDNVVYVMTGEGEFEERTVQLGHSDRRKIRITEGLEPGETVIYQSRRPLTRDVAGEDILNGLF
jgi:multidrug efflux pump subunit AcrA (membrane-fusion protein)